MRFTIFQDSHKGGRKVNQDRLAYSYGKDVLLMVIADGMGGHARGEIAGKGVGHGVPPRGARSAAPCFSRSSTTRAAASSAGVFVSSR